MAVPSLNRIWNSCSSVKKILSITCENKSFAISGTASPSFLHAYKVRTASFISFFPGFSFSFFRLFFQLNKPKPLPSYSLFYFSSCFHPTFILLSFWLRPAFHLVFIVLFLLPFILLFILFFFPVWSFNSGLFCILYSLMISSIRV